MNRDDRWEALAAEMRRDFEKARDMYRQETTQQGQGSIKTESIDPTLKPAHVQSRHAQQAAGLKPRLEADFEQVHEVDLTRAQAEEQSLVAKEPTNALAWKQDLDLGW